MARGEATRAAARSAAYRNRITELDAAGRDRVALAKALDWLRSETAHAARLRPGSAAALYRQADRQVAGLAGFLNSRAASAGGRAGARAAARASHHENRRRALTAAGKHREALTAAALWLQAESASAARLDPAAAAGMYRQLTDRITRLAASVPTWRPSRRTP